MDVGIYLFFCSSMEIDVLAKFVFIALFTT
jgi:hypothetical protein